MLSEFSMKKQLPTWNLEAIYKNFNDDAYKNDIELLKTTGEELKKLLATRIIKADKRTSYLENVIRLIEKEQDIYENLYSYVYAIFSTETGNSIVLKELDRLENYRLQMTETELLFMKQISKLKPYIPQILSESEYLSGYQLYINEALIEAQHRMSDPEERLAEELSNAGGQAWGRLQEAVSAELECNWGKKSGNVKDIRTVNELRNMAYDSSRSVRKRAYSKEIKAWRKMETPLAYALNGVKKTAFVLDTRRGWKSPIEKTLFQSRMSEQTLNMMLQVMEESLPAFRKYLNRKTELIGVKKLAFYDLFAPITKTGCKIKKWSYSAAKKFISDNFAEFSPDMGRFAKNAFKNEWIDAMPRHGKTGGAYCTSFPLAGESRVLCNYGFTFSAVSTVAHELGHAYHHHLLKDEGAIARAYPMTLAETASIFSETLIFNKAINKAEGFEKLYLTEIFLQEVTQVIVDILCRYYFEKNVFDKIGQGNLTPQEFSILMTEAQKQTYGDALDSNNLHEYMWAVKCHYYNPDLGFYNYPYAFGQLFSIALYQKYMEDPEKFPEIYKEMLKMTGRKDIKDVAMIAGLDVESKEFFQKSMKFITNMIDSFCNDSQK